MSSAFIVMFQPSGAALSLATVRGWRTQTIDVPAAA